MSIRGGAVRRLGETKETAMKFMVMHKMTAELETGIPDHEVIAAVGKLVGDAAKKGVFVSGEGLKPTKQRSRVSYRNGKRTITDGLSQRRRSSSAGSR
jgi:PhnB protein